MSAIIILLIISIQFAIGYFSIKYLTELNEKIIATNSKIDDLKPQIVFHLKKTREAIKSINRIYETFFKHKNKIKLYKNLIFLKSIIVTLILLRNRKNIKAYFSLYDIVSQITKSLVGYLATC